MRPENLNIYFKSVSNLAGVGPKVSKNLAKLLRSSYDTSLEARYVDLLFHLPMGYKDRRFHPKISELEAGQYATLKLNIGQHNPPPRHQQRIPYKIPAYDETGQITLSYFRVKGDYLKNTLPEDSVRYVGGKVDQYQNQLQISHPDFTASESEMADLPKLEPVYGMTAGLGKKTLRKAMAQMIEQLPELEEWHPIELIKQQNWNSFSQSIAHLHLADDPSLVDGNSPNRRRVAFDEIFANQLALALTRKHVIVGRGNKIDNPKSLYQKLLQQLPFDLTGAQKRSIDEIFNAMNDEKRMVRLLQGDVGSGKTIVALAALLNAVESGFQAALMAPTEILIEQHLEFIKPLCDALNIKVDILTGKHKGKIRKEKLTMLESGETDVLLGTHALFQKDIEFKNLGLAVIDEQHRFGVHQRLALQNKGNMTDLLVMTATPIPRTLVLSNYGDMDLSKLDEKPVGRKPIKTVAMPLEKIDDLMQACQRAVDQNQRIYWVCPLVEESEVLELTSAEDRFNALKQRFPNKVGLIHGRMKSDEKEAVMHDFQSGRLSILVATTVIEVGVNVPEATIMIIEHAERFGLSQLHQLRGRVGRSDLQSSAILLYKHPLGAVAKERLNIMRQTEDGFLIAEKDLELRGSGDILGSRQSGDVAFKLAQIEDQDALVELAHQQARLVVDQDPMLENNNAYRELLYLFEREEAIKLIKAG